MTSASTKSRTVRRMSHCCSESPSVSVRRRIPPLSALRRPKRRAPVSKGTRGPGVWGNYQLLGSSPRMASVSAPRIGAGAGVCGVPGWASGVPVARIRPIPGWSMRLTSGLASVRGRGELRERAVALPEDRGARERLGDLAGCVPGEPWGEQGGDHLAVRVAVAVLGEVRAERPLDGGEGLGSPSDSREVRVVPRGESHDHDRVTRFRAEVPRETTYKWLPIRGPPCGGYGGQGERGAAAPRA